MCKCSTKTRSPWHYFVGALFTFLVKVELKVIDLQTKLRRSDRPHCHCSQRCEDMSGHGTKVWMYPCSTQSYSQFNCSFNVSPLGFDCSKFFLGHQLEVVRKGTIHSCFKLRWWRQAFPMLKCPFAKRRTRSVVELALWPSFGGGHGIPISYGINKTSHSCMNSEYLWIVKSKESAQEKNRVRIAGLTSGSVTFSPMCCPPPSFTVMQHDLPPNVMKTNAWKRQWEEWERTEEENLTANEKMLLWCWQTDGKHMGRHRKEDRCIERMTETVIDEEMGGAAWRRNMKIVSVIVWIRACVLM